MCSSQVHLRSLSSPGETAEPVARPDKVFEADATIGLGRDAEPHVFVCCVIATRVPLMGGRTSQVSGRVDGPEGLAQYMQGKSRRPHKAPDLTCGLTGSVLVLGSLSADRRDLSWETRARLVHFEHLHHVRPAASIPRTPEECLEFEHRCWWMGISLKLGCFVRAVNRLQGLLWP